MVPRQTGFCAGVPPGVGGGARLWTLRLAPLVYSGDNAAMIAFAAVARLARGAVDDPLVAEAASRLPLGA